MEDLSHDQGDPHDQEMSADDAGGINGTGSPSHDAESGQKNFTEVENNFRKIYTCKLMNVKKKWMRRSRTV